MTALTYFPPTAAELNAARKLVRGKASRAELTLACNTLCQSPEADDRMMAREIRNVLWSDHRSELLPDAWKMADQIEAQEQQEALRFVFAVVKAFGGASVVYIIGAIAVRVWLGAV